MSTSGHGMGKRTQPPSLEPRKAPSSEDWTRFADDLSIWVLHLKGGDEHWKWQQLNPVHTFQGVDRKDRTKITRFASTPVTDRGVFFCPQLAVVADDILAASAAGQDPPLPMSMLSSFAKYG